MEKYELEDGKSEVVRKLDKKQGRASIWKLFLRFVVSEDLSFPWRSAFKYGCDRRVISWLVIKSCFVRV